MEFKSTMKKKREKKKEENMCHSKGQKRPFLLADKNSTYSLLASAESNAR